MSGSKREKVIREECVICPFKVIHVNINSIQNKVDELNLILTEREPDIVCISEHHLKKEQLGFVKLCGYQLKAAFCRQKKGGEEVLFLLKRS